MYGVAGETSLPERELDWLAGYEQSAPVRVGNAAAEQLQLDVFGAVLDALDLARRNGVDEDADSWELQMRLVEHLETIWDEPDHSLWEVRTEPRHFVHSKVMAWVAFDRMAEAAKAKEMDEQATRWRSLADDVHEQVCSKGFDPDRNTFVLAYDSDALDASLLLLPRLGFLPPDDPRMVGTIDAVQRELTVDGLVLRYRMDDAGMEDGLPGAEGAFIACSFWLVEALSRIGRTDEAVELFERLLGLANDVGLLAEEYDVEAGRQLGNFPQAYSHLALVNAALALNHHR